MLGMFSGMSHTIEYVCIYSHVFFLHIMYIEIYIHTHVYWDMHRPCNSGSKIITYNHRSFFLHCCSVGGKGLIRGYLPTKGNRID